MQLIIRHKVPGNLELPLSYHHILQAIIYNNLDNSLGYSDFVHNNGYIYGTREFRMFTFSQLQGRCKVQNKRITFWDEVSFEVRSPDVFMIRILADNISRNGITYNQQHFSDVEVYVADITVESTKILVDMQSPICVYATDEENRKTYFYAPDEPEFEALVQNNFIRKYTAYYGMAPDSTITIEPLQVVQKDKYVTKYKGFYLSGWRGKYLLEGERKYLDFLYQAGLGSKNSQGFGMFQVLE